MSKNHEYSHGQPSLASLFLKDARKWVTLGFGVPALAHPVASDAAASALLHRWTRTVQGRSCVRCARHVCCSPENCRCRCTAAIVWVVLRSDYGRSRGYVNGLPGCDNADRDDGAQYGRY